MDVALEGGMWSRLSTWMRVSILVLVDVALEEERTESGHHPVLVSILVLVDVALEDRGRIPVRVV